MRNRAALPLVLVLAAYCALFTLPACGEPQIDVLDDFQTAVAPMQVTSEGNTVCVLVSSTISSDLSFELDRYVSDLQAEEMDCHVIIVNQSDTCYTVKAVLQNEYSRGMVGAVMVGNVTPAWYEINYPNSYAPTRDPSTDRFLSDVYFMDLDGNWTDSDHNGAFDVYSGNASPEIWIGRINPYSSTESEISLLKNYFDKNHRFRTGQLTLPFRALIYLDDDWSDNDSCLYMDSSVGQVFANRTLVSDPNTTIASDYLDRLQQGYFMTHVVVHGSSDGIAFKNNKTLWLDPVRSSDMKTADPKVFFFLLESCENGRFDVVDYMAGSCVFGNTYSVVAIADARITIFINEPQFYSDLQNNTVGYAMKRWYAFNAQFRIDAPEFYAWITFGDPTLRVSLQTNPIPESPVFMVIITFALTAFITFVKLKKQMQARVRE